MKKYKSMMILVAVFVVLFVLYFIMGKMNDRQTTSDDEETYMVTELTDVVFMEYTDGETTMSFTKTDGEWQVTDDTETALDSDAVENIATSLANVQAVRVLEGADELSSYGLDSPSYTITLKNEAGTTTTLYIGDSVEENYYATINDKLVVYTIGSSAVTSLEFDITALEAEEEETTEETTEEATDETSEDTSEDLSETEE